MPSFEYCLDLYGGKTIGEAHKIESDIIMEETWNSDIESRVAYFYDYYHDDHITQLRDLNPTEDDLKTPIDIKYIVSGSQTYSKDTITYHLQLRPIRERKVDYYDEVFGDRYRAIYPCGLYVDIPDNDKRFNRWLVVAGANYYDPQFSTFEILPCNYVFQWVMDGKKYQVPAVLRSQNSYNSGVWRSDRTEVIEDQQKILLPLNRLTEKLYYNQRAIIDAPVLTEPRAWRITKVNRLQANGLVMITFAQDIFDQHKDYIELDESGNVIGMWADYYANPVVPEEESEVTPTYTISYSGTKPELKVRGGYKKFSASNKGLGAWTFTIDGNDASDLVNVIMLDNPADIKVKFIGDEEYLGKVMTMTFTTDVTLLVSELDVSIVAL